MAGHDQAVSNCSTHACEQDSEGLRDERIPINVQRGVFGRPKRDDSKGVPAILELDSETAFLLI